MPVADYLSDPRTGLARLIRALGRTAAEVAPVAEDQAQLVRRRRPHVLRAGAVARPYLQDAIAEGPATLDQSVASFRHQRPFLRNTAALFRELRPGARALRRQRRRSPDAFRVGTPDAAARPRASTAASSALLVVAAGLRRGPARPARRRATSPHARRRSSRRSTSWPRRRRRATTWRCFRNAVRPAQPVGDAAGNWQRFIIIATPTGPNSEAGPSSAPANGPAVENHLHVNQYPNTAAPGQPRECEAGNEPYLPGQHRRSATCPGTQQAHERRGRRREAPARHTVPRPALIALVVDRSSAATSASPRTSRSPRPFEVDAVFHSANSIRPGSPVRIAGVNVGKVQRRRARQEGTEAARRDACRSTSAACRSTRDATAKIRPRIFLEGNFFVDLKPGHAERRRCSTTATRSRSRRPRRRSSSTRC